jgi:hypothetical protein
MKQYLLPADDEQNFTPFKKHHRHPGQAARLRGARVGAQLNKLPASPAIRDPGLGSAVSCQETRCSLAAYRVSNALGPGHKAQDDAEKI